jgi:chromosome partitioning protein
MRSWGIYEAAKLCDTSPPRIRRYEEEGILPSPLRDPERNRRIYTLERINQIREILNVRYKRPEGSEPIIISVSNFKGGSCKTTTSTHLLQHCAIQGLRCLMVDCDPQASSTWILGGLIPDMELDKEDTIYRAAIEDNNDITRVIRKTYIDSLDIIPSNMFLQDIEIALIQLENPLTRFEKAIEKIKHNYDVIVFDCGPNISFVTLNAIVASNGILVPIPPDMYDFAAFIAYTGSLAKIFKDLNKNLDFFRILLTRYKENKDAKEVEQMMKKMFGNYMLTNYIVDTVEISKAANCYGTVYDTDFPRGSRDSYQRALISFNSVNNEIIGYFKEVWEKQAENNKKFKQKSIAEAA